MKITFGLFIPISYPLILQSGTSMLMWYLNMLHSYLKMISKESMVIIGKCHYKVDTPAAKKILTPICLCMIWNKGTLTKHKTYQKSYHSIKLLQIWIRSFKWGTEHPCRSRGYKNIKGQSWRLIENLAVQLAPGASGLRLVELDIFFWNLQIWPQIFWQPLDLQECTVPHLKDLILICLEPEAQGTGTYDF